MQIICFEDPHVERLAPIVHARPAYAITCAGYRLLDWLGEIAARTQGSSVHAVVRDYLQTLQQLDFGMSPPAELKHPEGVLLVNARLVPTVRLFESLLSIAKRTESGVVRDGDGVVLAARLTQQQLEKDRQRPPTMTLMESLLNVAAEQPRIDTGDATEGLETFSWPHDVVAHHMKAMPSSMRWRIEKGEYQENKDGVFVGKGVRIGDYASIHTNDGPIVLDDNVSVGPFCFLEGPLYAGRDTRVLEHAAIKDGVSLGHTVKIGGEVEASVIEPYTNKQHHGFLGHSYLGSWINLGAGTCNSDLKNTYGKINIQYGNEKVPSNMQFLGCIMGDYSKSAINTGIFTGKVIGVCSMLYGFVTSNVPSYVNYARLFGQTSLLPADVMINTQKRMFARRKVEQRDCDRQLISDMYDRTIQERETEQLGL